MPKIPAIFVGHGSPLNVIQDNDFTRTLATWGKQLQGFAPRAILCISAHWWVDKISVTAGKVPRTIYDFSGFPPALSAVKYPCPGSDELADQICALDPRIQKDKSWGIDHGTWSVLVHLFPQANVPVVQLSLDRNMAAREHFHLAEKLKPLRADGVLIIGSGNIVHSFSGFRGPEDAPPHPLGFRFDQTIAAAIADNQHDVVIDYEQAGEAARFAAPTADHFLPLLYTLGVRENTEEAFFTFAGFQYASMSMRCVQVGRA